MKRALLILLILILSGCAGIQRRTVDVTTFSPTGSLCMDALYFHMLMNGCDRVKIKAVRYGLVKVTCESDNNDHAKNGWTTRTWYGYFQGQGQLPDESKVVPACADPKLILGVAAKAH